MTELFQTNFTIIQSRWPEAAEILLNQKIDDINAALVSGSNQTISVNGIQLSSRHNRLAEAQLFVNILPQGTTQATVYGFGLGDIPLLAIEELKLKQLTLCILNPVTFALVLSYTDQTELLSQPELILDLFPSQMVLKKPYIAVTPDLELAADDNARLRDLLLYELNLSHANRHHQSNDPKIIARFNENEDVMSNSKDLDELKNQFKNKQEAIVIGAGPSLEMHYTKLAEISERDDSPLLIAVDTALMGLLQNHIIPDVVVSIDGLVSNNQIPVSLSDGISLVYFPRLSPSIINSWRGKKYCSLGTSSLYDELSIKFPKLPRLYANGSVIHPAVDLAVKLGCRSVTLCGADFCFCLNKSHAYWHTPNTVSDDIKSWTDELTLSVEESTHWIFNGYNEKVKTTPNLKAYLINLEKYIENNRAVNFFRASAIGANILNTTIRELA